MEIDKKCQSYYDNGRQDSDDFRFAGYKCHNNDVFKIQFAKIRKIFRLQTKTFSLVPIGMFRNEKKRSRLKLFRIFACPIMVPFFYKQDACSP
jgi:hypothetical protein